MITLAYSPQGSQLWLDDQLVAEGSGVPAAAQWQEPSQALLIGGDLGMTAPAGGQFEELSTFDYWPDAAQQQFYYNGVSRQVFLGGVGTAEEEAVKLELLVAVFPELTTLELDGEGGGVMAAYSYSSEELWVELVSVVDSQVDFVIRTPSDAPYDIFITTNLSANVPGLNLTNWLWETRASAGQTNVSVATGTNSIAFYRLGTTNDTDSDGLTDAFENLVSHSDPSDGDSDGDALPDGWEWTYFGGFGQSGTGDFDGDDLSNLETVPSADRSNRCGCSSTEDFAEGRHLSGASGSPRRVLNGRRGDSLHAGRLGADNRKPADYLRRGYPGPDQFANHH